MFEGSNIILSFLFSRFYLKYKHSINNYIGIFIIVFGLFLLGLNEYISNKNSNNMNKENNQNYIIIGIFFKLFSNFFSVFHGIIHDFFKNQFCHPIKCIGY